MTDTPNADLGSEPVTVIGMGLMGKALAAAFLNAGHPTTVWNRTPGKADDGADPGLASLYDVALLGVMWGTLNAFLHGAALLGAAKVDATTFAPFANQWVASVTGFISAYAAQIDHGAYPAEDAALETHLATMKYLVRESAAAGVDTDWPARIQALAERAINAGHAGTGYASLIEVFRGRA